MRSPDPEPATPPADRHETTRIPKKATTSPDERPHPDSAGAVETRSFHFGDIHPKLVVYTKPRSHEAEQFRLLRSGILFPKEGKPPRSIMVTSALPGEGKSFVSANLAVSIAQHLDNHVLVVDGDVRQPTLHTYFGTTPAKGLSDVLQGHASVSDILVRTPIERLTLLPAGSVPKNPSELLSSRKMGVLLREITDRYSDRMIIIDSPPPHLTSETSALARQVEGILLVVKFLKSNRDMTIELAEMLGRERIIGVVGNYLNLKALSYYGKSKYANYGKYYGN